MRCAAFLFALGITTVYSQVDQSWRNEVGVDVEFGEVVVGIIGFLIGGFIIACLRRYSENIAYIFLCLAVIGLAIHTAASAEDIVKGLVGFLAALIVGGGFACLLWIFSGFFEPDETTVSQTAAARLPPQINFVVPT